MIFAFRKMYDDNIMQQTKSKGYEMGERGMRTPREGVGEGRRCEESWAEMGRESRSLATWELSTVTVMHTLGIDRTAGVKNSLFRLNESRPLAPFDK